MISKYFKTAYLHSMLDTYMNDDVGNSMDKALNETYDMFNENNENIIKIIESKLKTVAILKKIPHNEISNKIISTFITLLNNTRLNINQFTNLYSTSSQSDLYNKVNYEIIYIPLVSKDHAMSLVIEKKNGKYNYLFMNTGEGINYTSKQIIYINEGILSETIIKINDVDINKINEIVSMSKSSNLFDTNIIYLFFLYDVIDTNFINKILKMSVKETLTFDESLLNDDIKIEYFVNFIQNIGNCSFMSIINVLYYLFIVYLNDYISDKTFFSTKLPVIFYEIHYEINKLLSKKLLHYEIEEKKQIEINKDKINSDILSMLFMNDNTLFYIYKIILQKYSNNKIFSREYLQNVYDSFCKINISLIHKCENYDIINNDNIAFLLSTISSSKSNYKDDLIKDIITLNEKEDIQNIETGDLALISKKNIEELFKNTNISHKNIYYEELKKILDISHDIDIVEKICNCLLLYVNTLNYDEIKKYNYIDVTMANEIMYKLYILFNKNVINLTKTIQQNKLTIYYLWKIMCAYLKLMNVFNKKNIFLEYYLFMLNILKTIHSALNISSKAVNNDINVEYFHKMLLNTKFINPDNIITDKNIIEEIDNILYPLNRYLIVNIDYDDSEHIEKLHKTELYTIISKIKSNNATSKNVDLNMFLNNFIKIIDTNITSHEITNLGLHNNYCSELLLHLLTDTDSYNESIYNLIYHVIYGNIGFFTYYLTSHDKEKDYVTLGQFIKNNISRYYNNNEDIAKYKKNKDRINVNELDENKYKNVRDIKIYSYDQIIFDILNFFISSDDIHDIVNRNKLKKLILMSNFIKYKDHLSELFNDNSRNKIIKKLIILSKNNLSCDKTIIYVFFILLYLHYMFPNENIINNDLKNIMLIILNKKTDINILNINQIDDFVIFIYYYLLLIMLEPKKYINTLNNISYIIILLNEKIHNKEFADAVNIYYDKIKKNNYEFITDNIDKNEQLYTYVNFPSFKDDIKNFGLIVSFILFKTIDFNNNMIYSDLYVIKFPKIKFSQVLIGYNKLYRYNNFHENISLTNTSLFSSKLYIYKNSIHEHQQINMSYDIVDIIDDKKNINLYLVLFNNYKNVKEFSCRVKLNNNEYKLICESFFTNKSSETLSGYVMINDNTNIYSHANFPNKSDIVLFSKISFPLRFNKYFIKKTKTYEYMFFSSLYELFDESNQSVPSICLYYNFYKNYVATDINKNIYIGKLHDNIDKIKMKNIIIIDINDKLYVLDDAIQYYYINIYQFIDEIKNNLNISNIFRTILLVSNPIYICIMKSIINSGYRIFLYDYKLEIFINGNFECYIDNYKILNSDEKKINNIYRWTLGMYSSFILEKNNNGKKILSIMTFNKLHNFSIFSQINELSKVMLYTDKFNNYIDHYNYMNTYYDQLSYNISLLTFNYDNTIVNGKIHDILVYFVNCVIYHNIYGIKKTLNLIVTLLNSVDNYDKELFIYIKIIKICWHPMICGKYYIPLIYKEFKNIHKMFSSQIKNKITHLPKGYKKNEYSEHLYHQYKKNINNIKNNTVYHYDKIDQYKIAYDYNISRHIMKLLLKYKDSTFDFDKIFAIVDKNDRFKQIANLMDPLLNMFNINKNNGIKPTKIINIVSRFGNNYSLKNTYLLKNQNVLIWNKYNKHMNDISNLLINNSEIETDIFANHDQFQNLLTNTKSIYKTKKYNYEEVYNHAELSIFNDNNILNLTSYIELYNNTIFDIFITQFEIVIGSLIKQSQYNLIVEMHKNILSLNIHIKQLMMGQGKSSIITPLLSLFLLKNYNMIFIVVPEYLINQTLLFMINAQYVFNRIHKYNKLGILSLNDNMFTQKSLMIDDFLSSFEKKIFICSMTSIKKFILYNDKMINLIKTSPFIFDEATDLLDNCKSELNITSDINSIKGLKNQELIIQKRLENVAKICFFDFNNDIINNIGLKYKDKPEIYTAICNVKKIKTNKYSKLLIDDHLIKNIIVEYSRNIHEYPDLMLLESKNDNIGNYILCSLLPSLSSNVPFRHYGLDKRRYDTFRLAVPYVAENLPSDNNIYDDPYLTITLSYIIYNILDDSELLCLVKFYIKKIYNENIIFKNKKRFIAINQKIKNIFGEDLIDLYNEKYKIHELFGNLEKKNNIIQTLLDDAILSDLTRNKVIYNISSVDILQPYITKYRIGMTGTPNEIVNIDMLSELYITYLNDKQLFLNDINYNLYHEYKNNVKNIDNILRINLSLSELCWLDGFVEYLNVPHKINKICKYNCFIDLGSFFVNNNIEDVLKKLCHVFQNTHFKTNKIVNGVNIIEYFPILYILYIDNGVIKFKNISDKCNYIEMDKVYPSHIDNIFFLIPQRYTVGLDLNMPITTHALVSLNNSIITFDDFLQAIYRLRQINSGQKVSVVIPTINQLFDTKTIIDKLNKKINDNHSTHIENHYFDHNYINYIYDLKSSLHELCWIKDIYDVKSENLLFNTIIDLGDFFKNYNHAAEYLLNNLTNMKFNNIKFTTINIFDFAHKNPIVINIPNVNSYDMITSDSSDIIMSFNLYMSYDINNLLDIITKNELVGNRKILFTISSKNYKNLAFLPMFNKSIKSKPFINGFKYSLITKAKKIDIGDKKNIGERILQKLENNTNKKISMLKSAYEIQHINSIIHRNNILNPIYK